MPRRAAQRPGHAGRQRLRLDAQRDCSRGGSAPAAGGALGVRARAQDLREALACGFRILLEKPIAPAALITAVATLAGEKSGKAATPLRVERALVD